MVGQSTPFPNRPFTLSDSTTLTRQDVANNQSLIHYEVWISKNSYSPTFAQGTAFARWGYDGIQVNSVDPGGFDFRASGPWLWLVGDVWIPHNADGTRTITVNIGASFEILGSAAYNYGWTLPSIARNPPPAPTAMTPDQLTRNSMRFQFNSNGDGGSPITGWQFRYSTTADFSSGVSAWMSSWGTSIVTGLKPGTRYWFEARGLNAAGAGPTSNRVNNRTLSGAWISTGTAWVPATVVISDGTTWRPANVDISNGTFWVPTG